MSQDVSNEPAARPKRRGGAYLKVNVSGVSPIDQND
jgi:hypothetical protein